MFGAILSILLARGLVTPPERSFTIRDDGAGPYITAWDVSTLGSRPTPAQIAAVSPIDAERAMTAYLRTRETDAALESVIDEVITAIVDLWPDLHAAAARGTLAVQASIFTRRIRTRVRTLRRHRRR